MKEMEVIEGGGGRFGVDCGKHSEIGAMIATVLFLFGNSIDDAIGKACTDL